MGKRKRRYSSSSSESSLSSGELRNLLGKLKKKIKYIRRGQGRPSKCRRRSTSSNCSIPSDKENSPREISPCSSHDTDPLKIEFVEIPSLNTEILNVLGEQNTCTTPEVQLHEDLVERWSSILTSGLPSEKKQPLLQKYPGFKNCHLTSPPLLNPEINSAIDESAVKGDEKILIVQKQVGAGLCALGMGLTSILNKNSESVNPESLALIKTLSDAARLLAGAFHEQSESRKTLLGTNLNSDLKDTLWKSLAQASQGFFKLEASIQPATSAEWTETTPKQATGHTSENNSKLPSTEAEGKGEEGQVPLGSKARVKAGILSKHMDTWCNITFDKAILSWIEGYRLPFIAHVPQVDNSYTRSWSKSETSNINSEIHRLLSMGAIVECKPTRNQFISPIFLIKKSNGKRRSMQLSLPPDRKSSVASAIKKYSSTKSCTIRQFASFVGKLISVCPAVQYGWAYTKEFERVKFRPLQKSDGNYNRKIYISNHLKCD
nr:unnamed protein product [Callosobruchus analis]